MREEVKALVGTLVLVISAFGCSRGSDHAPVGEAREHLVNDGEQKVTLPDPADNARFGNALALSPDLAVVGSSAASGGDGKAYLFERSGPAWLFRHEMSSRQSDLGRFGTSVAVSGNRIAIGAPNAAVSGRGKPGSVYIFEHDGRVALHRQTIVPPSGASASYGASLALEGDTLVIRDQRSIYLLEPSSGMFSVTQVLAGPPNLLRWSLALFGNTLISGLSEQGTGGSNQLLAAADVYVRTAPGAPWQFQQRLVPAGGHAGDRFGQAVALYADTALIGASEGGDAFGGFGAAYVFARSNATWTQQQKLTPSDRAPGDQFGTSVALAGEMAVVGAPYDDHEHGDQGSAYMFVRSGTQWTQARKLVASDGQDRDYFGSALDATGSFMLVGSPNDDIPFRAQGSAYFFRLQPSEVPQGEVCLPSCSGDVHCSGTEFCQSSGLCLPRKGRGRACEAADCREPGCAVCVTGFCSDGFCCEQACTAAGFACSSVLTGRPNGTCAPLLDASSSGGAGAAGAGVGGSSPGAGGSEAGSGAGTVGNSGGAGGAAGTAPSGGSGSGGSDGQAIDCVRVSPDGDDALATLNDAASPFRNVQPAIDFADARRDLATSVCIAAGPACGARAEYYAPEGKDYFMRNGISVFGRYESTTWTRCDDSTTELRPRAGRGIVFGPAVTTDTELNGVALWNWPAESSAAVTIEGAQKVRLLEVTTPNTAFWERGEAVYGIHITSDSEVTIERSHIFGALGNVSSVGVLASNSRLVLLDSTVETAGSVTTALQLEDAREVRVLRTTVSAYGWPPPPASGARFTEAVNALGDIGALLIEDSVLEAFGQNQSATGIGSASTNPAGVEFRRNLVHVEGGATLTGISSIGGGAIVDSNEVEFVGRGVGQAVGILCDGFSDAASCRLVLGNSVSAPSCSGSCAYDSTALVVAGMGTLVSSNRLNAGCSSGASFSTAVGLRASGDVRVENNFITGATCGDEGRGVQAYGVFVDSDAGTVDLNSNFIDAGRASAADCVTAGVKLVAGQSLIRNNIIAPGSCATAFNIDQARAAAPTSLTNNALAPGAPSAELWRIEGLTDPRTIAEVNAQSGASANFSGTCEYPLDAGSVCVDAGALEGAPETDIDGHLRDDGSPDVGPDELVDLAPCDPNPCQHRGTCIAQGQHYACECPPGITGKNCELTFTALAAAYQRICGIRSDGSLLCFGSDRSGAPPSDRFTAIASGWEHFCGIREDGQVRCWGFFETTETVPPPGTFTAISASDDRTCGLRTDGGITCWGRDPLDIAGSFIGVATGTSSRCGLSVERLLACWPGNFAPTTSRFKIISMGPVHGCGIRLDDTLECWGSNSSGEGTPPVGTFSAVSSGFGHYSCAIRNNDASLACWGQDSAFNPPAGPFKVVTTGPYSACGVRTDDTVACWGEFPFIPPSGGD